MAIEPLVEEHLYLIDDAVHLRKIISDLLLVLLNCWLTLHHLLKYSQETVAHAELK